MYTKTALQDTCNSVPCPSPVEPTICLLGKQFSLDNDWRHSLRYFNNSHLLQIVEDSLKGKAFELEFSQTDSDGNVTIKGMDITIPLMILKEVK